MKCYIFSLFISFFPQIIAAPKIIKNVKILTVEIVISTFFITSGNQESIIEEKDMFKTIFRNSCIVHTVLLAQKNLKTTF